MPPPADERNQFKLDAGTKVCSFVLASNFVDIIQGPLGSGKTRAVCARVMRHANEQRVSRMDGLKKSRWAIVRNTYDQLTRSTIRTWLEMFPEHSWGRFNWAKPPYHRIRTAEMLLEVDFLALDKAEDVSKLRSVEYTGVAFNEIQFIDKLLFDEATSRVGRYPPRDPDGGTAWRGVIADANPPDEDHWLAMMTGQVDLPADLTPEEATALRWPDDWGFYLQPPAVLEKYDANGLLTGYEVNPHAENLANLDEGYYQRQLAGKDKPWIENRLMNRLVLVVEGSPVWPMFRPDLHVAPQPLLPVPGHDVWVGLDFGRTPAAVFGQTINNRALIQYELQRFNMSAAIFAPEVKRFLEQHYPHHQGKAYQVRIFGDPKGADKGQADERTAYDVFRAHGMPVRPPPLLKQNMIGTRVGAVAHLLSDMSGGASGGLPRFQLSPACRSLKVAMAGRYSNERDEQGELRPVKNRHSHLADALQYLVLGMGEGERMIGLEPAGRAQTVVYHRSRSGRRRVA